MNIDLTKIFEKQRELDSEIHKNHNVTYKTISHELRLALLVELGELANEIRSFKFWSNKKASDKDVILEEYVDGIHFITSLCILYKVKPVLSVQRFLNKFETPKEITDSFIELYKEGSKINLPYKAKQWYINYLKFGFRLGFSVQDIIDAYNMKCEINHTRQKNNY